MIFKHNYALGFMVILLLLVVVLTSVSCGKNEVAENVKVHEQNAAAFVDKGNWAGAVEEYTEVIAQNPQSDTAYEGRGTAYTALQQYDLAIADLTKAIELKPDRGGPYFARGVAYRLQGNLDNAIADLSHAMGDRAKTLWRGALYERGLAYKAKGNLAEARADFERIVQLEKDRPGEADKSWAEKAQKELDGLGG